MGKALAGGSGWVLLCWSAGARGRMINQWAADHAHCLAGGDILLALDMYEHAYHLDFGANGRAPTSMRTCSNVRWEYVAARALSEVRGGVAPGGGAGSASELPAVAVEDLQATCWSAATGSR